MKESFSGNKAIILYGPPGSGKGTLANLLSKNFGFVNFDTGQHLREMLYDPKFQKNKTIQKEKLLNQSGKLNTPSFVLKLVSAATKKIASVDCSVIFTGSPRTIFEAFGDKKNNGLMGVLEKLYGRKNIFIFELRVSPEISIKRNSHRVICAICGQPSLFLYTGKTPCCAVCAGPFEKRIDDNPEIFETRLAEYQNRTQPIFGRLKEKDYKIFSLDGAPAPYIVFEKIVSKLKL
ncbi:MAG: nucleoside monophosphate kinase [bacterium]|nr:nucleoside monophosphate kinase [bacterium]